MYTIGEFAALGRVSVRMLRHYDAIGLLAPAQVDARTGYRLYAIDQLPLLLRIAELRELGVGLERIAVLAGAEDPDAALRSVLVERHRDLVASVTEDRQRIARIERRLRLLEGTTMSDVIYTSLSPVTVYAAHGVAQGMGNENIGPLIGPLIGRLDAALEAAGRPLIEPGIFWYDAQNEDGVGVHVSYVAEAEPVAGEGYDVVELPAFETAATLQHRGDMSGIGEAWSRLMEQIVADGYQVIGACREVYLEADGHEPGPDWLTELQAPVARV
ncbi:MAG: MerR family DNA-binding transcriptional regulator [Candidatus Microbacterium phytovorans]|uniref:MerR family DNA-binding transcriptional regulator n=1 Tax=Candidatus Microbacterium phytovorans TaxID=3121374 RepID=A0AAJ6B3K4_9MICO|nr:MerR family DNA-binding transcriptional regulator [Microbacterium sp.]WEK14103.1 MAG: MerR family DNA-binding transcriptional regulator [Microbacterium sp.]